MSGSVESSSECSHLRPSGEGDSHGPPPSTRLELLIKELRGKASFPTLKGATFLLLIRPTYMEVTNVPANENLLLHLVNQV